jgi:hypothetical protein
MSFIFSSSILTPLGLAACALLFIFSIIWRKQEAKCTENRVVDLTEKGISPETTYIPQTYLCGSCTTAFQNTIAKVS